MDIKQEYENFINNINLETFSYKWRQFFSYESNGFCESIKFAGITLWNDSDDERVFFDEENEYEPLDLFLTRKFTELLIDMNKILEDINRSGASE